MSFCFGAPEGTRTHTLKAREPKGDVTLVKVISVAYRDKIHLIICAFLYTCREFHEAQFI